MLDAAEKTLAEASAAERGTAETLAASWLTTQFEQDLIPAGEAKRMTAEHRETGTKEWTRAVYCALVGLREIGR